MKKTIEIQETKLALSWLLYRSKRSSSQPKLLIFGCFAVLFISVIKCLIFKTGYGCIGARVRVTLAQANVGCITRGSDHVMLHSTKEGILETI